MSRSLLRSVGLGLLLTGLVAGCSSAAEPAGAPAPSSGPTVTAPTATVPAPGPTGAPRVLASGLEVPWGIAFLPPEMSAGGTSIGAAQALVTERESARILRVTPSGQVTPVGTVEGVNATGEGGLLGIAVSPRFATDRTVYVSYTSSSDNRVVALPVAADGTVDGSAQRTVVDGLGSGAIHNGGGLAFGPDGMLWIGTGEAGQRARAQDPDDPSGKVLRVTPEGRPAPGNPNGSIVHSTGHRNVQGIAFVDGRVYASEYGASTADELNLLDPGNYGWPDVEGVGNRPGFVDPLVTWPTDDASPSGLAAAGGSLWMSALRGETVWRIPLGADGAVGTPVRTIEGFGRIRAVVATPDGSALWVTTSNRDGRGSPGPDDDRILVVPLR
ncbi:PQQ-dependent sugar dehydrogenase [Pseudonocardia endophytica]|uniref:Glucose/arabinose dehydrogenase n=1 Tax=Pseudonocardia endophytica TaxID=401976 RepID=A0A4R1HZT8_PSEEN|nr:PQQ-dependent sugar dehydrogenase [Pseudonocardia endophytica]TCK25679.1 glucose/arabinose dehydrogenase [Pseudonocardia endophytica]